MTWRRFLILTLGLSSDARWHLWRRHKPAEGDAVNRRAEAALGLH
jgi:hypothetical protein